jgi:hypothetical protein
MHLVEDSLPRSQKPTTGYCPESVDSDLRSHALFFFLAKILILSLVRGSVTNNNELCIGWLDLLAVLLQLQSIIIAHNKAGSIPYWTTSVFSYSVTDLVLIYESVASSVSLVRWLTLHSRTPNHDWKLTDFPCTTQWRFICESITCPPFIPLCEPNVEPYIQQFTLFSVYPLLCKRVLIP